MLLQVLLNLGPPDRFDDGLPDYVERLKNSFPERAGHSSYKAPLSLHSAYSYVIWSSELATPLLIV